MNPKLSFLIAAENILIEEGSKKPTFVRVFDFLFKKPDEPLVRSFFVGGKISVDEAGSLPATLKIVHEDMETVVATVNFVGNLNKGVNDLKSGLKLGNFEKTGRYFLKFYVENGKEIDDNRFYIDVVDKR